MKRHPPERFVEEPMKRHPPERFVEEPMKRHPPERFVEEPMKRHPPERRRRPVWVEMRVSSLLNRSSHVSRLHHE